MVKIYVEGAVGSLPAMTKLEELESVTGEISLKCFTWPMLLGKEHCPLRPLTGTPLFDSALKGTEVNRFIPIRVPLQQILEQCCTGRLKSAEGGG